MEAVYIHPTALVETDTIGPGTRIWAMAHVMQGARVGANCNIGDHCFFESGAVIGDNVTVKNGAMIWHGVTVEDGVFIGPGVVFTNDRHPRSPRYGRVNRRYGDQGWLAPTRVCQGAALGAGAVIVAGTTIGAFAMVGAGAVVTRSVLPHALVTGNPATLRGWVCFCGLPLAFQADTATCLECGLHFGRTSDTVICLSQAPV